MHHYQISNVYNVAYSHNEKVETFVTNKEGVKPIVLPLGAGIIGMVLSISTILVPKERVLFFKNINHNNINC